MVRPTREPTFASVLRCERMFELSVVGVRAEDVKEDAEKLDVEIGGKEGIDVEVGTGECGAVSEGAGGIGIENMGVVGEKLGVDRDTVVRSP